MHVAGAWTAVFYSPFSVFFRFFSRHAFFFVNLRIFFSPRNSFMFALDLTPSSTAVPLWGQLGTNYLELEGFVPKSGPCSAVGIMGCSSYRIPGTWCSYARYSCSLKQCQKTLRPPPPTTTTTTTQDTRGTTYLAVSLRHFVDSSHLMI